MPTPCLAEGKVYFWAPPITKSVVCGWLVSWLSKRSDPRRKEKDPDNVTDAQLQKLPAELLDKAFPSSFQDIPVASVLFDFLLQCYSGRL
ncbi:hypothetical protein TNIN_412151 [Trichonephila inaurata madagascariensis]|uniref:Uncharacterized protein n=1 Tax=Trichonephila inaurata madagascariensis TaxID=2747483 RepID=A0A8X6K9D7_9ARAC|nr:hypothetical protein TNIN_412151 [Trichonephila inaurata madagascariensis]